MSATRNRRIYVASSWRNPIQPAIVERLRQAGHDVYDFRNPAPGQKGFAWRDCGGKAAEDGPGTGDRTIPAYLDAIRSERAANTRMGGRSGSRKSRLRRTHGKTLITDAQRPSNRRFAGPYGEASG